MNFSKQYYLDFGKINVNIIHETMIGDDFINWLKSRFIEGFNNYISNLLFLILNSFIVYILKYLKNNKDLINKFPEVKSFLLPIVNILIYLFSFLAIMFFLNIIRKFIISKRHQSNLLNKPLTSMLFSTNCTEKRIGHVKPFNMKFEISCYGSLRGSDFNNYVEVDKFICNECNGEIYEKRETFFGNFIYSCKLCNSEHKLIYDSYTLKTKVKESYNAIIRREIYSKTK